MKVINLDKFRNRTQVTLDGSTYNVKGMTVEMYLHDPELAKYQTLDPTDLRGQVEAMVAILGKLSDIPQPILVKQEFSVLTALFDIVQGKEPEAPTEQGGSASPKE